MYPHPDTKCSADCARKLATTKQPRKERSGLSCRNTPRVRISLLPLRQHRQPSNKPTPRRTEHEQPIYKTRTSKTVIREDGAQQSRDGNPCNGAIIDPDATPEQIAQAREMLLGVTKPMTNAVTTLRNRYPYVPVILANHRPWHRGEFNKYDKTQEK